MDKLALAENFEDIFESFSSTGDGKYVFICDIPRDYSIWSKDAVDYFGLPSNKMRGAGEIWQEHIEPESREFYAKLLNDVFIGKSNTFDLVYRAKNKYDKYVTCSGKGKLIRDADGNPRFFAGSIVNHEMGDTVDPVTGLYSRSNLMTLLREYRLEKRRYYLLITGIRNFFDINSTYGYSFGNKVLKEIAEKLLLYKKGGNVFRADGTKMVILMGANNHTLEDVRDSFEKIKDHLQHKLVVDNVHIVIDVAGSILVVNDLSKDDSTVYNSAIYALTHSKEENLSTAYILDNSIFDENTKRIEVLTAVRNSITDNFKGFYLCYQPIVSAKSDKVVGMEALIRWKDEKFGSVSPNNFIPWLERDPVFYELGNWILRTAMTDTKPIVKKYPDFKVNVNLAYPQLQRVEFKANLDAIVKELDFPADNLKLELTERCKMIDIDTLREDMIFFKTRGFQTALDDFGTGYSALNLLTELPIDQVKIDRSFIMDIQKDIPKQSLLRAITSCAFELGKTVCIEGIETAEIRDYLKTNFNVDSFQGYYYSKPITIDEFNKFIEGESDE